MSMQSDLVVADADAAEEVLAAESPASDWEGISFQGLDNIKITTLLSLLSSQSPSADYDKWSDALSVVGEPEGPAVFAFTSSAVKLLAKIAAQDEDEFEALARSWAATEEFDDWQTAEVNELLRDIGDLAESAILQRMSLFLWMSH